MYLDWIDNYSEMHFDVIAAIFNASGITRGAIREKIGRQRLPESSADADLYKLLIRDLSMGGIIRQHRETDYHGNFVAKQSTKSGSQGGTKTMVSAFDNNEKYELTELGIHDKRVAENCRLVSGTRSRREVHALKQRGLLLRVVRDC